MYTTDKYSNTIKVLVTGIMKAANRKRHPNSQYIVFKRFSSLEVHSAFMN